MLRKLLMVLWLVAIILLTTACGVSDNNKHGDLPQEYDGVDPVFRENYNELGGEEILGPAISPAFEVNHVLYQYTAAALMVRDPNAPNNRVFHLASLGLDMGIAEPPIPSPSEPNGRYVEGHVIDPTFLPLFDRLDGLRYVGRPLTELHFNQSALRYEQYFENLGMYWLESEGPESVRLLSYGAWKCNAPCRGDPEDEESIVVPPYRTAETFKESVARLGADFTGFAIAEAYPTPDGYTEQVFENLVLVTDPEAPGRVYVRPIIESLGIKADRLSHPSGKEGYEFYPVKDGLGYNISKQLVDYIARHGGYDASGAPITELFQFKNNIERQCFTNVCLELAQQISGAMVVRPAQLGFEYKRLPLRPLQLHIDKAAQPPSHGAPENSAPETQPTAVPQAAVESFQNSQARELTMRVWKSYPLLAPDQNQEIGVSLQENNHPLPGIETYLLLTFPDGQEKTYYMFPTGDDGVSKYLLDPIDLPNGAMVLYQVCILDLTYERYCYKDSFLMWQNP